MLCNGRPAKFREEGIRESAIFWLFVLLPKVLSFPIEKIAKGCLLGETSSKSANCDVQGETRSALTAFILGSTWHTPRFAQSLRKSSDQSGTE